MINAEKAAGILGVAEKEISRFDGAPDLFNEPNTLSGWLCRRGDHRYGALVLDEVNGKPIRYFTVLGTPKQNYPFGRTESEERLYHWPAAVARAVAWEKLDGTNIFGYAYPAGDREEWFVTYKTRLTPTLRESSAHGDFAGLWQEVLAPEIEAAITPSAGLSFELWGHRNHHLISYAEPLAATLLFGVDQDSGALLPPTEFDDYLRWPQILAEAEGREGLTAFYEKLRAMSQDQNKAIDEDHLEGTEGAVLYLEDDAGLWSQWKCKPESVEALHWAGDYIPLSVILPTAWNALESEPELTPDAVVVLLAEEFPASLIRNSSRRIEVAVGRVLKRLAWRQRVKDTYSAIPATWEDGKGAVMRLMCKHFQPNEMREVFNALRELGIAA